MNRHEYAIKLLQDKTDKLEEKRTDDEDLNDGLDVLIKQLSDSIKELRGQDYD